MRNNINEILFILKLKCHYQHFSRDSTPIYTSGNANHQIIGELNVYFGTHENYSIDELHTTSSTQNKLAVIILFIVSIRIQTENL